MYVWSFCLHTYVFTTCVLETERVRRRCLLELELQMVMGHHVGTGNQTLGPLKSNKCS